MKRFGLLLLIVFAVWFATMAFQQMQDKEGVATFEATNRLDETFSVKINGEPNPGEIVINKIVGTETGEAAVNLTIQTLVNKTIELTLPPDKVRWKINGEGDSKVEYCQFEPVNDYVLVGRGKINEANDFGKNMLEFMKNSRLVIQISYENFKKVPVG